MNSIIANTPDAKGFSDGSKMGFIVPVKPQPIFSEDGNVYDGKYRNYYKNDMHHEDWIVQFIKDYAPYTIGQEVVVREKCRTYIDDENDQYNPAIEYQADGNYNSLYMCDGDGFQIFNSDGSERMIPWKLCSISASRTIIIPTAVKCCRVQDVTKGDMVNNCNYTHLQITGQMVWENYDKKHGNTWYEKVEDSYKSYIIAKYGQSFWDSNSWVFFYTSETKKAK